MSLKTIFRQGSITQKRFKNLGKIVGIGLFTLLMLTNIKLALLDDSEIASGDVSVLGIELTLFEGTFASEGDVSLCYELGLGCDVGQYICTVIYRPGGGYIYCAWSGY